jgi:hypothetical protein
MRDAHPHLTGADGTQLDVVAHLEIGVSGVA